MPSKEIDRWLKAEIEKVPEKLIKFRDTKLESKMVYYTGNWQTDVMANLHKDNQKNYLVKCKRFVMMAVYCFFKSV